MKSYMDGGTLFNKLWVIESLPKGDLKTGTQLVDNQLKKAKTIYPNLEVELITPENKTSFIAALEKIRDETRDNNSYPMIHFECHGYKDGIGAANNELISWDDLRLILLEINQACKMHLVVVLAACNGIYLINVATKLDRAPFWAIIGPEVEVKAGEIQRDFGAYYTKFFESLDADAAVYELNRGVTDSSRQYHFISAAGLFVRAYVSYHNTYCIGKGKRERVESLVTQAMEQPDVRQRGIKWARQYIKNGLKNEEDHFNNLKRKFFFIDQFEENEDRFTIQYDQVLSKCNPNN